MSDNESNNRFWKKEIDYYKSLDYKFGIKYQSWQPAKWASNSGVVERIARLFNTTVKSSIELGAGSCAFSFVMNEILKNQITAVDICKNAVEFGNMVSSDLSIKLNYINKNFFEDYKSFQKADIVFSLGVIEHLTEKEQNLFLQINSYLSKKYVLVAIPNQEAWIFKNYIHWVTKNANHFKDEHRVLDLEMLKEKIKSQGLRIVYEDGFHVFLSEKRFWNEMNFDNYKFGDRLKELLLLHDRDRYSSFPYMDFSYEDIEVLKQVENSLGTDERIQYGFMNYVLAEKI